MNQSLILKCKKMRVIKSVIERYKIKYIVDENNIDYVKFFISEKAKIGDFVTEDYELFTLKKDKLVSAIFNYSKYFNYNLSPCSQFIEQSELKSTIYNVVKIENSEHLKIAKAFNKKSKKGHYVIFNHKIHISCVVDKIEFENEYKLID